MELKPLVLVPSLNPFRVVDGAGLDKVAHFLSTAKDKIIGWDTETTPVKDWFTRRVRTWQVGNKDEQYVIDLLAFTDGNAELLRDCQGKFGANLTMLQPVLDTLTPALCSGDYLKVGVSLSFEYMCARWNFGMRPWKFYDCAMVEKVLWAGAHSLKHYEFYSMEDMIARYFGVQVDKTLQESFNLTDVLTDEQIAYAALDTRIPLAIRSRQLASKKNLYEKSLGGGGLIEDKLVKTAQIENDAIGAFIDMHIHGENINRVKWTARTNKKQGELLQVIADMDNLFIPVVGDKRVNAIPEELVLESEKRWKMLTAVSSEEIVIKGQIRINKKLDPTKCIDLQAQFDQLEAARKVEKDHLKKAHSELKKERSRQQKLLPKCEGNALINYGSDDQMLDCLKEKFKGLKELKDTGDDTLAKFANKPVIALLRKYRELSKQIDTYGMSWVTEWTTRPIAEEGWLHPGDGKLHCIFNQLDAETGRSSSEKPNGQNLPQDKECRSCFEADPPNPEIRISKCCEADTIFDEYHTPEELPRRCNKCNQPCETHPEEYVIVTADMSGAELRIIAELALAKVWIDAFNRGEDVHSVGTELLYPDKWPILALLEGEIVNGKEIIPPCAYYTKHTEETIKKNPLCVLGDPMRQKCDCPEHKELRNGNKSTNFLLAYGGTEYTLAERIGKTVDEARELMAKHKVVNAEVWDYLEKSGIKAKIEKAAWDMFGRRRLFPAPTWESAKADVIEQARNKSGSRWERCMRRDFTAIHGKTPWDAVVKIEAARFEAIHGKKPKKDELYDLLHHESPEPRYISSMYASMHGRIERQGKNHAIQGSNASIAKLAMGCGFDEKQGKPYLWHTLLQYRAKLLKFVHDELVVQCPKQYGKFVADLIGDAFKRAAAERMTKVVMEFDYNIASYWKK